MQNEDFDIMLEAELSKKDNVFVELNAFLKGFVGLECDLCAEHYKEEIEENTVLLLTDQPYKRDSSLMEDRVYDIIEFLDGNIDFDEIITSEVNAFRHDYHKCKNCK